MYQLRQNIIPATVDFSKFGSRAYLQEYYGCWDEEDIFSQTFLHEAYKLIDSQESMLEVGGGPTLYQCISARRKVNSIVFTDFLKENRQEILAWKYSYEGMFNWDAHFEYVRKLEKEEQTIEDMKAELRTKLIDVRQFNVLKKRQFLPKKVFDVVSVHFCPESITKDEAEFQLAMRNVVARARAGGFLVMSFLKEAQMYAVGDVMFCAYPLTESALLKTMSELGCEILVMAHGEALDDREYAGTMSLLAKRR